MLTMQDEPEPEPEPEGLDFVSLEFLKGWREMLAKSRPINVILAGRPGAGKSTLVNTIFGKPIAKTGVGPPITEVVRRYDDADLPISVYDTPGIELDAGSVDEIAARFRTIVDENLADPDRRIHFALYCVGVGDVRFQPYEQKLIQALSDQITAAVVITKARSPRSREANELRDYIDSLKLPILGGKTFVTLAQPIEPDDDGDPLKPAFGLPELVNALAENLTEAERFSFARYQRVSLDLKFREAQKLIAATATTAAGIAAIPIPILDAIPIAAAQLAMLARITALMGLKVDPKALAGAVAALIGMSQLARTGVSMLKFFFPGIGSMINASVAAGITTSLGDAYLRACRRIAERQNAGENMSEAALSAELIQEFKRRFRD